MDGQKNISNQTIHKTLNFEGKDIKGEKIGILRTPYYLEENEFSLLISINDGFNDWAKRFLFVAFGLFINLLSKLIVFISTYACAKKEDLESLKINIENWEYLSCLIAFLASLFTLIIAQFLKSDKAKLKEKIKLFFLNTKTENAKD